MHLGARNRQILVGSLLLAVVTLVIYSRANFVPFIAYDDNTYVTNNLNVQAGLKLKTLTWALTTTEGDTWHPLTWLSHALDCQLYGLKPAGHHFTNVLLHVLNAVLLFLLLARVTGATVRSWLVAALFALHPFNVESVAWVAERKNVLSTLFFLLALGAYGWYAYRPNIKRYLVVALLFVLGLAAKPMVITLPFVLLLLDVWPLQRIQGWGAPATPSRAERRRKRKQQLEARAAEAPGVRLPVSSAPFWRLVLEKLPLLAFSAGSAVITIIGQRSTAIRTLERFPLGTRLENALYSYAMYVWKAFWPTDLALYYPHPGNTLAGWQLGLAALFLTGVSVWVWKRRLTHKYLVTGWLWYLATLVPVIGLVQVGDQAMADRYAYLPLIGVFVMAVWGAGDWVNSVTLGFRWRAAIATSILAILSWLTWRQVGYWHSDYDVWSHALQVTPNNMAAKENLSKALAAMGRADEALSGLERAAQLSPGDPMRHANLGSQLLAVGRMQEAIAEYQMAAQAAAALQADAPGKETAMRDIRARSYESMATIYDLLGDYPRVRESYRQALNIDPNQGPGMIHRLSDEIAGDASAPRYMQLGILLQEMGRLPEAQVAYHRALALDPALNAAKQALDKLGQEKK